MLYILNPKLSPSRAGSNDRVMISAALRGRVKGITECGKVFGCQSKRKTFRTFFKKAAGAFLL